MITLCTQGINVIILQFDRFSIAATLRPLLPNELN